jgi:hypothetical protein
VAELYDRIMKSKLPETWLGAEWWAQVFTNQNSFLQLFGGALSPRSSCCALVPGLLPIQSGAGVLIAGTNRIQFVLSGMQDRTFGPYLAVNNRILISLMSLEAPASLPQVYEPGKGLAFHFDKDESRMAEDSQMVHPITSTILYLTGGPESKMGEMDGQTDAELKMSGMDRVLDGRTG